MLRSALLAFSAFAVAALFGCGSATKAPSPVTAPIAGKPDVLITFDGEKHACIVALYTEPQGSTIPCADLIPFLKDELKVPSGSIYDTSMDSKADEAEVAKATQSLKAAGYRFIGGH